jgi:hypothetical protein
MSINAADGMQYALRLEREAIDNGTHPMLAKIKVIYDKVPASEWERIFGKPHETFRDGGGIWTATTS